MKSYGLIVHALVRYPEEIENGSMLSLPVLLPEEVKKVLLEFPEILDSFCLEHRQALEIVENDFGACLTGYEVRLGTGVSIETAASEYAERLREHKVPARCVLGSILNPLGLMHLQPLH